MHFKGKKQNSKELQYMFNRTKCSALRFWSNKILFPVLSFISNDDLWWFSFLLNGITLSFFATTIQIGPFLVNEYRSEDGKKCMAWINAKSYVKDGNYSIKL
jgi:hypothetical protein